jgi:hypothetical protein
MRKILLSTLLSLMTATLATATFAAGKSSGHSGGQTGASQSAANSNGIRATDRNFGQDRAAERRNAHSLNSPYVKKVHFKKAKPLVAKAPGSRR